MPICRLPISPSIYACGSGYPDIEPVKSPAEPMVRGISAGGGSLERTRLWSGVKFPGNRAKNREFRRFPGPQLRVFLKNKRRIKSLYRRFSNHRTGNFFERNREFALTTDQGAGSGRLGRSLGSAGSKRNRSPVQVGVGRISWSSGGPARWAESPERNDKNQSPHPYQSVSLGASGHGQGLACRTRMGGQKTKGWRYCSFWANQSRKSNNASTWSS